MVKTNNDIAGEHCIMNVDGVSTERDENKNIAWKIYDQKPLNTMFA